jgi:starch-binding outer membrane protein, SusD/RagB family
MKRTFQIIILLLSLSGCESLFHPEELSIGNIEGYDELVSATNGVYGKLSKAMSSHEIYSINQYGDDLAFYWPYFQPIYYKTSSCDQFNEGEYETSFCWNSLYSVISSVNNIICQFEISSSLDQSTKQILGEMYMIRAYCNFRLTRTYGEIPIVDDNEISFTISKSSFTEVYEFIESDLKTAISLLPASNSSARIPYETPTRGSAKSLLAEVYLSWAGYPANDTQKYGLAASEALGVIDSAGNFGLGLVEDFAYLWDQQHVHNQEGLFVLNYQEIISGATNFDGRNHLYEGIGFRKSNNTTVQISPSSLIMSFKFWGTELNFYNSYPPSYRKDITLYCTIYVNPQYINSVIDTGYIHIDKVSGCARIGYRKFFYDPDTISYKEYHSKVPLAGGSSSYVTYIGGMPKIYLFRYAQTLLTYSEAAARSGQLNDKAYECVNQIRRRAHHVGLYSPSVYDLQPGLSAEAFADSVVQERAWELAGEPEGRWFDIVRLNMIKELPNLRDPREGGPPFTFDESAYFYPIPQGDIDLNPDLGGE